MDVAKVVQDINIHKASAIGNLTSRVLKDAFEVLITQLTYLFNLSFIQAEFPKKWKEAQVVPLPKSGDQSNITNFRPVALLPLPGKLIERLVHNQITEYFETHEILLPEQGGFRKGHSTISTVANITDTIRLNMESRKYTVASFIDLSKAFDTVNFHILLSKLKKLGLHQESIRWVHGYLSNRVQRTMANGELSDVEGLSCGVPQGSILGPLSSLYRE